VVTTFRQTITSLYPLIVLVDCTIHTETFAHSLTTQTALLTTQTALYRIQKNQCAICTKLTWNKHPWNLRRLQTYTHWERSGFGSVNFHWSVICDSPRRHTQSRALTYLYQIAFFSPSVWLSLLSQTHGDIQRLLASSSNTWASRRSANHSV